MIDSNHVALKRKVAVDTSHFDIGFEDLAVTRSLWLIVNLPMGMVGGSILWVSVY